MGRHSDLHGVSRVKRPGSKNWIAQLRHEGESHHLGYYHTEGEAGKAYDNAVRWLGLDCPTNFPLDGDVVSPEAYKAVRVRRAVQRPKRQTSREHALVFLASPEYPTELPPGSVAFPLNRGYAIVSPADWEALTQYRWHEKKGYALTSINGKSVSMHRWLMGQPEGLVVDHINNQGLDNRRENLRVATLSQNAANIRRGDGLRGVTTTSGKTFVATICQEGRVYRLGRYGTKELAGRAYDNAGRQLYGEFFIPNFDDVWPLMTVEEFSQRYALPPRQQPHGVHGPEGSYRVDIWDGQASRYGGSYERLEDATRARDLLLLEVRPTAAVPLHHEDSPSYGVRWEEFRARYGKKLGGSRFLAPPAELLDPIDALSRVVSGLEREPRAYRRGGRLQWEPDACRVAEVGGFVFPSPQDYRVQYGSLVKAFAEIRSSRPATVGRTLADDFDWMMG
jgi:HNH endonuclease